MSSSLMDYRRAGYESRGGLDYESELDRAGGGLDYRKNPALATIPSLDYRRATEVNAKESSFGGAFGGLFSDGLRVRAVLCVCIVNLTSCCGMACMMAPFAELLLERACERRNFTYPSPPCDNSDDAQTEAAHRMAYFSLASQIPNLLTVGLVGTVSDAISRPKALMIPLVSGGACMLAIALVPSGAVGPFSDGFWLLLCITALSSCGGGQLAILASSFSVVADITEGRPPETIALCFGLAELWLFFGMMSGPTLAGKLADDYSVQQSFWLGVLCFTIGSTSVLVLMRDLRPLSARPPFKMEALNPFRSMSLLLETSLSRCFFAMLGAGTPRPH